MHIRTVVRSDLQKLIDLTIETFRPFYEGYVHPLLGHEVFRYQHGQWEQDYRNMVPDLHVPAEGRHLAVAQIGDEIAGYVAWKTGENQHGEIVILAVASAHRRQHLGRDLCQHAIEAMKATGIEVVEIGTGDDPFHAPARGLYENLGFTKIPIAAYVKKV